MLGGIFGNTLLRLMPYFKPHALSVLWLFVFSFLDVLCKVLSPVLIGHIFDECFELSEAGVDVKWQTLSFLLLVLLIIYLGDAFFSWITDWKSVEIVQNMSGCLREDLTRHILKLDVKFFEKEGTGALMSRVTNDVELIRQGLGNSAVQMISTFIMLLLMLVVMLFLNWRLAVAVCFMIPLVLGLSRFVIRQTRQHFAKQQKLLSELSRFAEEELQSMRLIKGFGCEDLRLSKFKNINDRFADVGAKAQIYSGLLMPLLRVLDNVSYIVVAVLGALLAFKGLVTIGVIQTFLLYTKQFLRPINRMATQINEIQAALAGAARVFEVFDCKREVDSEETSCVPRRLKGAVKFENVSFGYSAEKCVLNNVSFEVKPGETVAIIGRTGVGKTTLVNLLLRFFDVNGGSIKLDDVDVRDLPLSFLRRSVAIVPQDVFLFSESIRYNIVYGMDSVEDDKVDFVAKAANIDGVVSRMPDGYDTVLTCCGENVSSGQKQLFSMARVMLREAAVFVLDEATSNMDQHTECLIQDAVTKLRKEKTCLLIAHRLSTVRNADRIVVLSDGGVAEVGTHAELMAKHGVYYEIYSADIES